MAALFRGVEKPNWNVFLHWLKGQLKQLTDEEFELALDQKAFQDVLSASSLFPTSIN